MTVLGLTGSIGMGKSTVARMFEEEGVPVFDADAAVHRLQGPAGALVAAIEASFPGTTGEAGVDRSALADLVVADPDALRRLEAIVHSAVAAERASFLTQHSDSRLVVLDIPLLFEAGTLDGIDKVAVVSAPEPIQRSRVLARPGMTEAKLESILARQMPDAEKRRLADFIIPTGGPLEETKAAVRSIIACLAPRADS